MYDVMKVVNWFLSKESMTPKKIQIMVYYAYAWVLTIMNDSVDNLQFRLFGNPIEAWVHGPVVKNYMIDILTLAIMRFVNLKIVIANL